jgi:diguanylate cyclase (GGDEF)-like protein/PAS domain S-box-containing protein
LGAVSARHIGAVGEGSPGTAPAPGEDLGPFRDPAMVRRLVDDGMVLFVALRGDGEIEWVGRSSESILGRSPEELTGTSALDLLHPDDVGVVLATLDETARNADERILAVLRARHADGSWVVLEFGGIDLRDDAGDGSFLVWGRSYESATRLTAFLEALLAGQDLRVLFRQIVDWCDGLAPYSQTVLLRRRRGAAYEAVAAASSLPQELGGGLALASADDGWLRSLATGAAGEVPVDELPARLAAPAAAAGVHALWAMAIAGPGDRPDGLLLSWRQRPGHLLATHARHLEAAARLAQVAFEWARTHQDLVAAATTDPLTGLANRTQLAHAVGSTTEAGISALLFCDLDDFKGLNDRHGHVVGDRILQAVGRRFRASLRPDDTCARLGGDEFAAWCPQLSTTTEATDLAARLVDALARPIEVDGRAHEVTCSVGVTVTAPGDEPTPLEALLHAADEALYEAKAVGKNRWILRTS